MTYQKIMQSMSKKACEWIELDMANYNLSYKSYMEDKDKRAELLKQDNEVRKALEMKEVT